MKSKGIQGYQPFSTAESNFDLLQTNENLITLPELGAFSGNNDETSKLFKKESDVASGDATFGGKNKGTKGNFGGNSPNFK